MMLLLFLSLSFICFSDSMVLKDNRSFPSVWVDQYQNGQFSIRTIESGQASQNAFPVQENQVHSINCGPIGEMPPVSGRKANLYMQNGQSFNGVTILSYSSADQGPGQFNIRQAGAGADDPAYPVKTSTISRIEFGTPWQPPGSARQTPAQAPPGTVPGQQGMQTPVSQGAQAFQPTPGEPSQQALPETGSVQDDRLFSVMEKMEENLEEEMEKARSEKIRRKKMTPFQKFMDKFADWLITTGITAAIGGLVVFMILKHMNEDVTFGKAYLVGIILAVVPGLLANVAWFVPLCCFSLILWILIWYYTARTILMAMLDIKKSTAFTIIVIYILMKIAILFAVIFFRTGQLLWSAFG